MMMKQAQAQSQMSYQKHDMNDYRPMRSDNVNTWQYQNGMDYRNTIKTDEDYKMIKMLFNDFDKTNANAQNPKFTIDPNLFSYFDSKKPVYISLIHASCQDVTYTDPIYLSWVCAPFDTRQSWFSAQDGNNFRNLSVLGVFNPKNAENYQVPSKIGAFKTSVNELMTRNAWEFLITDDTMEILQVGTGFDYRALSFTLLLWQE